MSCFLDADSWLLAYIEYYGAFRCVLKPKPVGSEQNPFRRFITHNPNDPMWILMCWQTFFLINQ